MDINLRDIYVYMYTHYNDTVHVLQVVPRPRRDRITQ